jgi:signal transduction histidine kinase
MNLRVALSFLIQPPGSLVYHLTLAVIFGLLAILAVSRRPSLAGGQVNPWGLVAATLLAVRVVLLLVAALSWLDLLQGMDLPQSLGRFASIIGVALLGWASIFPRPTKFADLALTFVIMLCILGLVASIFDLVSSPIVSEPIPEMVWGAFGLLLTLAAAVGLALVQPDYWSLSLLPFLLLMIGFVLNLSFADEGIAAQGFVRLTEMPSYALFAFLGSRFLIGQTPEPPSRDRQRLVAAEERIRFLEGEIGRLEFPFERTSDKDGQVSPATDFATEEGKGQGAPVEADESPRGSAERARRGTGPLLESRAALTPEDQLRSELQIVLGELAEARTKLRAFEAAERKRISTPPPPQLDAQALQEDLEELRRRAATSQSHVDLLLSDAIGLTGALQRKFLERLDDSLGRMWAVIDDISGSAPFQPANLFNQPVDLMEMIDAAMRDTATTLHEREIALELHLPDVIPPVSGNADTINQIMLDLLQHAIHASPAGSTIELRAFPKGTDEGDFLIFSVSDSSGGIPLEELGALFQEKAGDQSGTDIEAPESASAVAGVKTLCESLGWRVWVDSEMGIGSTFSILMPLYEASESSALGID